MPSIPRHRSSFLYKWGRGFKESFEMSRAFYVIGSLLLLPGCLLFLEEPADFPDAPTDATCLHDAAVGELKFKDKMLVTMGKSHNP